MRALTCGDAPQRRSPDVDDKRGLGFKSLGAYFREIHLFYRTNNTLKIPKTPYYTYRCNNQKKGY